MSATKQHSPVNVIVRWKDDFQPLYLIDTDLEHPSFSHIESEALVMPHCCAVAFLENFDGKEFYKRYECIMYLPNVEKVKNV